jgi:RHS repeat-associated protein
VRDAQGNVLAAYSAWVRDSAGITWDSFALAEQHIYGSSRVGYTQPGLMLYPTVPVNPHALDSCHYVIFEGWKRYEITNHLGNVLAVVTDRKRGRASSGTNIQWFVADVLSAQQYYPFGMLMPGNASATLRRQYNLNSYDYRYGFNGKEGDDEVKGDDNQVDFGARPYDPRSGRFLSVDPMANRFPEESNYIFAGNAPITLIDVEGKFKFNPETLKLLKEKYPIAYKYLVETSLDSPGNILELTKSETVINAIITNTQYYHANLDREQAIKTGKEWTNQTARDILVQNHMKLTKEEIVKAFTYNNGPEIVLKSHPGDLTDDGANGFNQHENGTNYTTPIELNVLLFEGLNVAKSDEEKQAALLNIVSVLIHEYIEDFAQDNENYGHGDFGAESAQKQIFAGERPGIFHSIDALKVDFNFTSAKDAIAKRQKGGSNEDPSVIPTLPKN